MSQLENEMAELLASGEHGMDDGAHVWDWKCGDRPGDEK